MSDDVITPPAECRYGVKSLANLSTCHRDLQIIAFEVDLGWEASIVYGHRGEDLQNELYRTGFSKKPYPMSKHNSYPSMAMDIAPWYNRVPHIPWQDEVTFAAFGGYVLGVADRLLREGKITHKVRWGRDWDQDRDLRDQTFNDYAHVELVEP